MNRVFDSILSSIFSNTINCPSLKIAVLFCNIGRCDGLREESNRLRQTAVQVLQDKKPKEPYMDLA